MYYKKNDSQSFSLPGVTTGYIYPSSPKGDQTIAVVETKGRYPEQGYSLNDICSETLLLTEGQLTVDIDGQIFNLEVGDLLTVLPGKKYRLWGEGKSIDFISPAWDKKQNHILI